MQLDILFKQVQKLLFTKSRGFIDLFGFFEFYFKRLVSTLMMITFVCVEGHDGHH